MKSPRKSSKTKRAPKVPEVKNHDLDAIAPYEEPIKQLELDNWSQEEAEQISYHKEIMEIKPKKLTGKHFIE